MKFTVEQWQPEYGAPAEDFDEEQAPESIDLDVELPAADWRGIAADRSRVASRVIFVDGVRRIDARVWIEKDASLVMGLCASCAAGIVVCDGTARVEHALVQRMLISPAPEGPIRTRHAVYEPLATPDDRLNTLMNGLAQGLSALEVRVSAMEGGVDLLLVDGPLRGREQIDGAVGYIKSHRVAYLPAEVAGVVPRLDASARTPVFLVKTSWSRYSWYMRLPGGTGHPWAGIVRLEAPPNLSRHQVVDLASVIAATIPAFASQPHKDGRAPQNLYPIKGLEDALRARLGYALLLHRSLVTVGSGN